MRNKQKASNDNYKNDHEDQKDNDSQKYDEINENEETDEVDEIAEEVQEKGYEDKKTEKDEFETLKDQGEERQSKLEQFFIYLKNGFTWRPIPTINSTVICLGITGIIFIMIGIIIFLFSNNIREIEIRYDENEKCEIGTKCDINFTIPKDMKKNVFVYYRLKNFYQNHRRYIISKSNKQLKGNVMNESEIKDDCDPIILNRDIYEGVKSTGGRTLDPDEVAHPCGLIAKSFFNDSYEIKKQGSNEEIIISGTDIAWNVDKEKYKNSKDFSNHQWLNVENERFMVWMRPAAMPDFRKPWGRIEKDLNKGEYTLTITNNYPVKSFDGEKYFILSTVNHLGGRNYFLGILYFAVGGVSIVASILFWIGYNRYNTEKSKQE